MKLRLCLAMESGTGKEVTLKLNIAPSKSLGFSNFVNTAFMKGRPVKIYFEKQEKGETPEKSKISGTFKFVEEGKQD